MKMFKPWLSLLAIILTVAMLLPGCKPTPPITLGTVSPRNGVIRIEKPPRINEQVKLTYNINYSIPTTLTRVWLEFSRFDPAILYPLGKSANAKDIAKEILSGKNIDDPQYRTLEDSITQQPETRVLPEQVVVEQRAEWLVDLDTEKANESFAINVNFPDTGEWLITGYWEIDGEPVEQGRLALTVNTNDGQIGWRKDYSINGPPYLTPRQSFPVGLSLHVDRIPAAGKEIYFNCLLDALIDPVPIELRVTLYHMEGPVKIKLDTVSHFVNSSNTWKGTVTSENTVEVPFFVIPPGTGDYYIDFLIYPALENVGASGVWFCFNIGEETGMVGWALPH